MPYCPNCGTNVQAEHHYCGQCGYPLAEQANDDSDGLPPSGTAASRQGFLSGRSIQYLNAVSTGDQSLDPDTVGYANLSRDIAPGLADFATVSTVEDLNLLSLLLTHSSETNVFQTDFDQLNGSQRQERLMWLGFVRLPAMYDRILGTEWSAEFSDSLSDLIEEAQALTDDE